MKISHRQLLNLPVVTESNHRLGVLESFNIDIDSQSVLEYKIKPTNPIKELINGDLLVARGQVVDINQDRMVVSDTLTAKEPFKKIKKILAKEKEAVVINKN